MKEREHEAIPLEFLVVFPTVLRMEKLVAIVQPGVSNAMPDGKIDTRLDTIIWRNRMRVVMFVSRRNVNVILLLEIISKRIHHTDNLALLVKEFTIPIIDVLLRYGGNKNLFHPDVLARGVIDIN